MGADPQQEQRAPGLWRRRLTWLLGLWLAGVLGLGVLAYALRWLMRLAGLAP